MISLILAQTAVSRLSSTRFDARHMFVAFDPALDPDFTERLVDAIDEDFDALCALVKAPAHI